MSKIKHWWQSAKIPPMVKQSLPNDVISKIASLAAADPSTRKALNAASKITRTQITLSESEKMQIVQ
jgi:hypothetical protein